MGSAASTCLKDDCPDEAELRALLKGGVTDEARLGWLEERLSDCAGCRERLEKLSAPGFETAAPVTPASEVLRAVMDRAKAGDFSGGKDPVPDSRDLDFLEAGDDETSLGQLGKYQATELLAEGGMGLVLRARDPDLDREVAIKVLSPRLAAKKRAREMFLREARSAAGVEHENVLPIYLVEKSGDLPWFVMPLVRGGTVEDRIGAAGEGSVDFDDVLEMALKATRGLAAAHAKGLIHRDIKPANIMLDDEGGNVWLADFGLAAAAEAGEGGGAIAGTPGFMAPEVAAGEVADERSDLFSLGCVFFAMVTGRQAFSGDTVEQLLDAVKQDEPEPLASRRSEQIPVWFGDLIGRMLEKSPGDRPGSAEELVGILESRIEERRKAAWRARVWLRLRRGLAAAAAMTVSIAGILWLMGATGRTQGLNRVIGSVTGGVFSVKGRFGIHQTLGDAVRTAGDGSIVEVFGNDTWDTPPVRIEGKSLTIRAARGDVPVLSSVSEVSPMIWSDSNLAVEGLVLEQPLRPKKSMPSLILVSTGGLRIERCRLLSPNRARDGGLGLLIGIEDSPELEMSGVEIQGRHSYGIGVKNRRMTAPCAIRLREVVYLGPLLLLMHDERTSLRGKDSGGLKIEVEIEKCSAMTGNLVHISSRGAVYPVTIRARRNLFDCRVGLLTNLGTNETLARKLFRWEDRENRYAIPSGMFFGQGRGTNGNPMPRTRSTRLGWDEVSDWFGLERGGSRRVGRIFAEETRARFEEAGTLGPGEIQLADDFTASGDSIGADTDQVGPAALR